jgi:hypothetical protein
MGSMGTKVETGAIADIEKRGWFVGHFMDKPEWATTDEVEVKWGNHAKGEQKAGYGLNKTAQTVTVLARGVIKYSWLLDGVEQTRVLEGEGTYIYCPPDVPHRWEVLEPSIIVTVRWPSVPGDQQVVE